MRKKLNFHCQQVLETDIKKINMELNVLKPGSTVVKTLIWNITENEVGFEVSECELTFHNGIVIKYECKDIEELKDENVGIYELLIDGVYKQIEDWE